MRAFALLASLVLCSIAFAGCADDASQKESKRGVIEAGGGRQAKPLNLSAIEKRINRSIATSGEEKLGDWFVLSASAGPEGNLTAFKFNIPPGALVQPTFAFGRPSSLISMEIVPIVVGDAANILEWTFVPIILEAGRARLTNPTSYSGGLAPQPYVIESPRIWIDNSVTAPSKKELSISLAPRLAAYGDEQLRTPGSIFFVVGARSTVPVEFGIALRLLDHQPAPREQAMPSLEAFLDDVGRSVPYGIKRVGTGHGFLVASYDSRTNLQTNSTNVLSQTDQFTASVKVEDRISVRNVPGADVRDTTLSSGIESAEGWTFAQIRYTALCGTGKWSVKMDVHGKPFNPRGLILEHIICGALYGYIVEYLVFGTPAVTIQREGPGAAKVAFEFQVAEAGIDQLTYLQVSFGSTLSKLIGHPGFDIATAETGVAGNVPPGAETVTIEPTAG